MENFLALLPTAAESAKPAGGAAIGEVIGATAGAMIATGILFTLIYLHRTGQVAGPPAARRLLRARLRDAGLGHAPVGGRHRLAPGRPARHVLGHRAPHQRRARRGPAREPGALPDPRRAVRHLRGRLHRRRPPEGREADPVGHPDHRGLVRPGRRAADGARGGLRAARLPARRHVAPALRPGRHALGPDPPDADRRRRHDPDRPGDPPARGSPRRAGPRAPQVDDALPPRRPPWAAS